MYVLWAHERDVDETPLNFLCLKFFWFCLCQEQKFTLQSPPQQSLWCRGNIPALQAGSLGSIPSRDIFFFGWCNILNQFCCCQCYYCCHSVFAGVGYFSRHIMSEIFSSPLTTCCTIPCRLMARILLFPSEGRGSIPCVGVQSFFAWHCKILIIIIKMTLWLFAITLSPFIIPCLVARTGAFFFFLLLLSIIFLAATRAKIKWLFTTTTHHQPQQLADSCCTHPASSNGKDIALSKRRTGFDSLRGSCYLFCKKPLF